MALFEMGLNASPGFHLMREGSTAALASSVSRSINITECTVYARHEGGSRLVRADGYNSVREPRVGLS